VAGGDRTHDRRIMRMTDPFPGSLACANVPAFASAFTLCDGGHGCCDDVLGTSAICLTTPKRRPLSGRLQSGGVPR
jgi:hypothetical protein